MHLAGDLLEHAGGLLLVAALAAREHLPYLFVAHACDDRLDLRGAQGVLDLALELRFGYAHGDDRHQTGSHVVAFDLRRGILEVDLELAGVGLHILAHLLDEGVEEAVQMHAAARCLDDVDEAADRRVVVIHPAEGDVDAARARHHRGVQVAAGVHRLGLLLVGVLAVHVPHVAHGRAVRKEVHEVDDASLVQEFLHTRVRGDRGVGLLRGFCDLGISIGLRFGGIGNGLVICIDGCVSVARL